MFVRIGHARPLRQFRKLGKCSCAEECLQHRRVLASGQCLSDSGFIQVIGIETRVVTGA
jgi:hypothetical protein